MIYINPEIDYKSFISQYYDVYEHELILKVSSPNFDLRDSYGVPFQPVIKNFTEKESYTHDNVVVFPLIPQYFHNFFELFTKMIRLKELKENFTAIIIFNRDEFDGETFTFLNRPAVLSDMPGNNVNAAHIKEFLEYAKIPFECALDTDIYKIKPKNTYLFFDDGSYMDIDPTYKHKDKTYTLAHFLKIPATHVIESQMDSIRSFFPTYPMIKNKKTWASRKATWDRKWKFEDDLEDVVKELGYEIVYFEFMTLLEQIQLIQESEFFGCLYGSGLVNTCFMNNGSKSIAVKYIENYNVDTYKILNRPQVKTHIVGAYDDFFIKKWLDNTIGYITEVGA